ncbi:MAG: hypothetical protein ACYC7H_00675, partial [Chloroflexota bacterium]
GNRSLFFGEREGLYMYLLAQGMISWGHGVLTLRTVSALVGTATIPALFILARLMYNRRVATFAAIGLAAAFWHVSLSRLAFRATTLPLFETIALALLWGALRCRRRWPRVALFAVSGLALGLVLYTYIASRMVPVVVLAFLASQLLWDRSSLRPVWLDLPLYAGGTALVFWPLAAFFVENPTVFVGRMEEVSVSVAGASTGPALYAENLLRVAGMFFVAGDQNWRHNLAGLPVFDPVFAIAFVVGVGVCLWGWRRSPNRFLILWAGAMLVPTIAAVDAPHYLRADGALPALFLLAAVGFDAAIVWGAARWSAVRRLARPTGLAIISALLLLVPAVATWYTYFNVWLPRPETYYAFDGPLASAGNYLASSPAWRQSAAGRQDFFLTTRFWQDRATMMYYLWPYISGKERDDLGNTRLGSRWLDEAGALPLRPDGARYLLADEESWALTELRRLYGADAVSVERASIYIPGLTPFVVVTVPAGLNLPAPSQPLAVFGGAIALADYRFDTRTGGDVDVTTRWQVREIPAAWKIDGQVLDVFVHALDSDGSLLAVANGIGYQPVDWRKGESFVLRQTLRLPPGTAPGNYTLVLGVTGPDGQRIAPAAGTNPDRTVPLGGGVTVGPWRKNMPAPNLDRTASLSVDGRFALAGAKFPAGTAVTPGQALSVELYWEAKTNVGAAYDVILSLVGPDGKESARSGGPTAGGRYPTDKWRSGDVVRDPRQLPVSARAAAGEHRLSVTVTEKATGKQTGPFDLGTVTVQEVARAFNPPATARSVPAPNDFGGTAALLGYSLQPENPLPGEKMVLTLYWKAETETDRRLKVFTHVLGPAGVVAQSDAEPADGARPLTGWVAGEVVTDTHPITLPAPLAVGEYGLEVGLYDPTDGKRLDVRDASGRATDSRLLLAPLTVRR